MKFTKFTKSPIMVPEGSDELSENDKRVQIKQV